MEIKIEKRGLHNWKNLFRKPNFYEWVILFMLIMVLFMTWAYQRDTKVCREFLRDFEDKACLICNQQTNPVNPFDNININEENLLGTER
ncbi:MAG: hypothetical protein ACOC56_02550 [Atribacterota bacterium]